MKPYKKAVVIMVISIAVHFLFHPFLFAQDLVVNGGFEEEGAGWTIEGDASVVSFFAADGYTHTGNFRLSHWSTDTYEVYTYQVITGLAADTTYTLRGWVDSNINVNPNENDNECALILKDYGGDELRADVIETSGYTQFEIAHISVTTGEVTIGFKVKTDSESWCALDNMQFYDDNGEIPPIPEKEEMAGMEPIFDVTKSKNLLVNPDFEDPLPIYDENGDMIDYDWSKPAHWTIEGNEWGFALQWSNWSYTDNREGFQLTTKWDDYPYIVSACQTIQNLEPGKYIFKGFAAAGVDAAGEVNELSFIIKSYNKKGDVLKIVLDTSGTWKEYTREFYVTSGEVVIEIHSDTVNKVWAHIDDLILVKTKDYFLKGVDISESQRNLDLGETYLDAGGIIKDPVQILHERGINLARIRVWVNPAHGICGKEATLKAVTRTIAAGMEHMIIDFHYSDTWADPGKQYVPEAWLDEVNELIGAIQYNLTAERKKVLWEIFHYSRLLKTISSHHRRVYFGRCLGKFKHELEKKGKWMGVKRFKKVYACISHTQYRKWLEIIKIKLDLRKQLWDVLENYSGLPEENDEIAKITLMELGFDYTIDMCEEILKIKRLYRSSINLIYQPGNEIIFGTLWPYFKLDSRDFSEYENLARFLKIVVKAVTIVSPDAKILMHSDHKDDADKPIEERRIPCFARNLIDAGVDYDILGYSYYDIWHGTLTTLSEMIMYVSDVLGKEVMNVEFSKPWTSDDKDGGNIIKDFSFYDVPLTVEGQALWIAKNVEINRMLNTLGVCYWGGTYTAVEGNGWDPDRPYESQCSWENQALFDFEGNILDSVDAFNK